MIRQILLLFCCILWLWPPANSQSRLDPYFSFDVFTTKNGLSNNRITDIIQARNGVLWISTARGLTKYDGRKFTQLHLILDSLNSLMNETISDLEMDTLGNLWIGAKSGLYRLDKNENIVKVFPTKTDSLVKDDHYVRAIYISENNDIWFDTAAGMLYNYQLGKGIRKKFKHNKPGQIHTYLYHSIFPDSQGKLWIGGRSMPICYFDPNKEVFNYYPSPLKNDESRALTDVMCYYETNEGVIYMGNVDGLFMLDTVTASFTQKLKFSTQDLVQDQNNRTWVLNGGTLKYWDESIEQRTEVEKRGDQKAGFPSKYPTKLFVDNAGNLWIGSVDGLAKYSPSKNKIKRIFKIYENPFTLSSNKISCVLETKSGKILVGTEDKGLDVLDGSFRKIKSFSTHSENSLNLASNSLSNLYEDRNGNIYIGLWGGVGFHIMNPEMTKIRTFSLVKGERSYDWYSSFHEREDGIIVIGTWGSYSIILFDPVKGEFIDQVEHKPGMHRELGSYFVKCFLEDHSGNYWIGSSNRGLFKIDNQRDSVILFHSNNNTNSHFFGDEIHCIFEDDHNRIWVGGEGLFLYNAKEKIFEKSLDPILTSQEIISISQDNSGALWLGGSKGIIKYLSERDSVEIFGTKDGMAIEECSRAVTVLKNGMILLGSKEGLHYFDPKLLHKDAFLPKPSITGYKIFDKSYSVLEEKPSKFVLPYQENQITFQFLSDDLSDPGNSFFRYKLNGLDEQWQSTNSGEREVVFKHLRPGNYQFLLQTANADKVWGKKMAKLKFEIKPPFWKSWWFIVIEVAFMLLLVFSFIKYRENKIRKKHQLELLEQRLLRAQMNPHFIFNALGAIQSFIFKNNILEAGSYLSRFADLMRSILYSSREELISLDKEVETIENYLIIQQLRFDDKFSYSIIVDESINKEFTGVPPMLIQPLVENSIEHGFKNINYHGEIIIKVRKANERLYFEISDNGTGLQKSIDTSDKNPKHRSLALSIIRERLRILNTSGKSIDELVYENQKDKIAGNSGTKVSFSLPLIQL